MISAEGLADILDGLTHDEQTCGYSVEGELLAWGLDPYEIPAHIWAEAWQRVLSDPRGPLVDEVELANASRTYPNMVRYAIRAGGLPVWDRKAWRAKELIAAYRRNKREVLSALAGCEGYRQGLAAALRYCRRCVL